MIKLVNVIVPPPVNNLFFNVPGKGRVKSSRYRTWKNAASWEVAAQKPIPLKGPVHVKISIEDGSSRADIDGLIKAPLDMLVDLHLIEGDDRRFIRSVAIEWSTACTRMEIEVWPTK